MSNAIRCVPGELQRPAAVSAPVWWDALCAELAGRDPPCLLEFTKFVQCLSGKRHSACASEYLRLKACLREHGFIDAL